MKSHFVFSSDYRFDSFTHWLSLLPEGGRRMAREADSVADLYLQLQNDVDRLRDLIGQIIEKENEAIELASTNWDESEIHEAMRGAESLNNAANDYQTQEHFVFENRLYIRQMH